jgi:RNA polymerase sigma factor (sigma-70 family)
MAARHGMREEWGVVQQAIAGNVDAQERLFAPHTGRLYRTTFAVLRNEEDAEDALQDGLFKAYTSLRSFQGRSSFSTWLTRIVINSALMTLRRKSGHPEASLDEILHTQPEWFGR